MADEQTGLEQEEQPERPEWLDPRYENVEAQARAYSEAQRLMTQTAQRASAAEQSAAEMAQRLEALEQRARQPQTAYDPNSDPYLVAEASALEEGDYMRAAQIRDARNVQLLQAAKEMWQPQPQRDPNQDQLAILAVEQAIQRELGDDLDLVKDQVEQVLTQSPHLMRDPAHDPLGAAQDYVRVARWVKGEKLAEQTARLNTQQTQASRDKRLAQTATGGGRVDAPRPGERETLMEAMRKLPKADSLLS